VVDNNEEMLNQYKDVAVRENSDKKVEWKYRQINEVVVSQELEGGGDKKSVNLDNTIVSEVTGH
jgi:hypothetical protein